MRCTTTLALAVLVALAWGHTAGAATIYVDTSNPGCPGTGTIGDPFCTIQDGIDASSNGDEVVILPGTYVGVGNVNLNFGGKDIVVRSVANDPNTVTIDCQGTPDTRGVVFQGTSPGTLSGVTITRGNTTGGVFFNRGGAIFVFFGANPTIEDCIFIDNTSWAGGAVFVENNCDPIFRRCRFESNTGQGTFRASINSSPTLVSCIFEGNGSTAVWDEGTSPTLVNCLVTNNSGNGLRTNAGTNLTATNCTISGNSSSAVLSVNSTSVTVANSILWNNGGAEIEILGTAPDVTYSNVEGGYAGTGNIDADPLFDAEFRPGTGSLSIDAGNNGLLPADTADLDDDGDTFEPLPVDIAGAPRVQQGGVDMGAYEFTPPTIWVDASNPDCPGSGTPGDPFCTIQAAINAASAGDEVVVRPGTYLEAIDLDGKAITVRSDSGDPADTIIDGNGADHVVRCDSGEGPDTVLAGFTVTGGNAQGAFPEDNGGGMYISFSSPTVRNCVLTGNSAGSGGGMLVRSGSPLVTGCMFTNNSSGFGGALNMFGGATPTVVGCTFVGNTAPFGGAITSTQSSATLISCSFTNNTATTNDGGAMYIRITSNPTVANCTFVGNTASNTGGAIHNNNQSSPAVDSCTFSGNSAANGGAIYNTGASNPVVTNSILWGDSPNEIVNSSSTPTVSYSNVQGGYAGTGNIGADPLFGADLRLSLGSPCIDTGNTALLPADTADLDGDGDTVEPLPLDLAGLPRVEAASVDMGAYEWQVPMVTNANTGVQYGTIQPAIDAALSGHVLILEPAIYPESINFEGKAVTVRSTNPFAPDIVAGTRIVGDGSPHIVECRSGEGSGTVLSGLTIADGVADGPGSCSFGGNEQKVGAGMYIAGSDPTVSRCVFENNWAECYGGAVWIEWCADGCSVVDADPTFIDCVFDGNDSGIDASAVFLSSGNNSPTFERCLLTNNGGPTAFGSATNLNGVLTFIDCQFVDNSGLAADIGAVDAIVRGCTFSGNAEGALHTGPNSGGDVAISDCVFSGNSRSVANRSAGLFCAKDGTITNCEFIGNTGGSASALYLEFAPDLQVVNCIFRANGASTGGVIWRPFGSSTDFPTFTNCTIAGNTELAVNNGNGRMDFENCIVWGNAGGAIVPGSGTVNVSYSNVEGGFAGTGNISEDPLFLSATDLRISPDSPCANAGLNANVPADVDDLDGDRDTAEPLPIDLDGTARFIDVLCDVQLPDEDQFSRPVDMGAYEVLGVLAGGEYDCNENGRKDGCDAAVLLTAIDLLSDPSSQSFRGTNYETYADMVAAYGVPWGPDTGQDPEDDANPTYADEPARLFLAIALQGLCDPSADDILREVSDMYLLLGNEAYSDALDSTVGSYMINLADVGDYFAFDGVTGIDSLVDEELGLLRGREIDDAFGPTELPGHYPDYGGFRAAIYNRLPPNADGAGDGNLAYRSTYGGPLSNNEAAMAFPQGHGDAYGYYLSAVKAFANSFNDEVLASYLVPLQPNDIETVETGASPVPVNVPFRSVRAMADAMSARARAASLIVDRTFRNDYQEGAANPGDAIVDADSARAWGMADWAARSAMGSYLDWALVNHLIPEGDPDAALAQPNRQSLDEVDQLVGAVSEMQARVDWAASGRNPLGLIENSVPFGINAGSLANFVNDGSGKSHYEQVRDPAVASLANASVVLQWANESAQRMRGAAEMQSEFEAWTLEQEIAYESQLIEIYGLPSPSDGADNDLDGLTEADGDDETQSPDLIRFLLTNDDLADLGEMPRTAPGEIQVAMSEIRVAQLRLQQARAAFTALNGNIRHLASDIRQRRANNQQASNIIWQAAGQLTTLEDELEQLAAEQLETDGWDIGLGIVGDLLEASADCFGGSAGECAGKLVVTGLASGIEAYQAEQEREQERKKVASEFDANRERININAWQDAALLGIEGNNAVMEMTRELEGLLRQTPAVKTEIATAREQFDASVGQLSAAISRGERLQADRERMRKLARDELEAYRWSDLAFRVYRNESLQKYRGFFDLAARYVMLAGRSYAYEYNERNTVAAVLSDIHRETRLGSDPGVNLTGGLWGVIADLDMIFQAPFELDPSVRKYSLRENLLGLPNDDGDPASYTEGSIAFRGWLESNIVQQLESVPDIERYAELSSSDDYGPAIVLRLSTQIGPNLNFFGQSVDEYGREQFNDSFRTNNMLTYEMRFENAGDPGLSSSGAVNMFLIPFGESVFRDPDVGGVIEDSPVRGWGVVNQNLRSISTISGAGGDWESDPQYNAWVDLANGNGDFFNGIRRFGISEGQVPQADPGNPIVNNDRVGWTAWNSTWLLAVPGGHFTSSQDPEVIRRELLILIYGEDPGNPGQPAPPELDLGMTDIEWWIQGYRRVD